MDERLPQLHSSQAKSQVLEIHTHENHYNKESHRVGVLARICLSIFYAYNSLSICPASHGVCLL
jgi:hypothetical protein